MARVPALAPAGAIPAVPPAAPQRPPKIPTVASRVLGNGLTVLAVRQRRVPLVQLRLVLPVTRPKLSAADHARQRLLGPTLLSGTKGRSALEIAELLQTLGANLSAGVDVEDLSLSGSALARSLPDLLGLTAEVLTDAAFPAGEVAVERERVRQELALQGSQPSVRARVALAKRVFGAHPYGAGLPDPEVVGGVTPAQLSRFVKERVSPSAGHLVLVGDVKPEEALDQAEAALGGWSARTTAEALPSPAPITPGPIVLVDRPGAVQTNIRIAGPGLPRQDPGYAALAVANVVFGGYFSSRLTANLREDKGYTYSPHSSVEHHVAASIFTISADVATEFTAPSLVEIQYELGRMATLEIKPNELAAAQRYLTGTLALAIQTQSGLANYLALLAAFGMSIDYLRELPAAVAKVTLQDVQEAAAQYLAPSKLVTVLLGDASVVRDPVGTLGPLEVTPLD